MNKIEKIDLILENQKIIMKVLRFGYNLEINGILGDSLVKHIDSTEEALNPTARKLPYVDSLKDKKIRKERVRKIEKELDKLEKMDTQLHNKSKVEKK